MPKPAAGTHPAFFERYINLVPEDDLMTAFKNQLPVINNVLSKIDEEKSAFAYATGKWTLKELLQHMIDTERIFAYRSLCFARKESQSLPGFDENIYAANSHANNRTWRQLVDEFLLVRKTTEILFTSFNDDALNNKGIANNNAATALSMGFTSVGHVYHHFNIINERYL
jgi:DinB superfamily